jgi:tricorn protease
VCEARDIADLLLNQAGKQVLLHVKRGRARRKRAVIVTPVSIGQADGLRYSDWEQEGAAGGHCLERQIGYLHLRAMGARHRRLRARLLRNVDSVKA